MSNSTYFVRECPTCGRQLQIRVEYLGKQLVCQHCQGQFEASDPANGILDRAEETDSLLRRADELLESTVQRKEHPRFRPPR